MKIVAIADTHGRHEQIDLPDGDVLVHAGDFTRQGAPEEVREFADWLGDQPHEHQVVVAGNHETCLEPDSELSDHDPEYRDEAIEILEDVAIYLENGSVMIDGVTFFGSPNTPTFEGWAFERDEDELEVIYEDIPQSTDVLVTHTPLYGVLDRVAGSFETKRIGNLLVNQTHKNVGSVALHKSVEQIEPAVHLFGHIHPQYGTKETAGTRFYNVALVDNNFEIKNDPVVIEL